MAAFFKNKSAGWYLSAVSTLLAVVALIAYIAFGTSSQTFVPAICICLVAAVVLGAAMVLYQGALEGYAAIAMALQMEACGIVHDQESFVITIKPTFSAWADRHSTLRQLPERK